MEVLVRLLELVRGRAIDHPASELGRSEELLREWREAFRLVEQRRLRIRVAFEEVNRLPVVPDVALKLQRARVLRAPPPVLAETGAIVRIFSRGRRAGSHLLRVDLVEFGVVEQQTAPLRQAGDVAIAVLPADVVSRIDLPGVEPLR